MRYASLCLLLALLFSTAIAFAAETTTESKSDPAVSDAPITIRELIEQVREGGAIRQQELEAREQRFLEARDEREALLADIKRQRVEAEALADRLRGTFEAGEDELAELETSLDENSEDLRDVFAAVNQVSADSLASLQNSMVSAEIAGREPLLEKLASSDALPSADELRALWLLLLEEMHESGRVSRFEAEIIAATGEEQTRSVTRIGTFTALSEGDYLRFLPESGRLLALARQPAGTSRGDAVAFEEADAELVTVALDPSRGAILSLIVQTPEFTERMAQGGVIGYVIIALGVVGLALGVERLWHVAYASSRTKRALTGGDDEHAIGQLRSVASDPDFQTDADALSAKIDEILTNAAQRLNRGLPIIAVLAAVSPLLGLLGTVTGMIETFQVITLFGAGDPRLMSNGISQALITTQLGLAVAIPLLLIHSFAQSRANTMITQLDEVASEIFATSRILSGTGVGGAGRNVG